MSIEGKYKLAEKALLIIEAIASGGLIMDVGRLFRIAHMGRTPDCFDSHPDWLEELNSVYERFKSDGFF
jgi:hypothetical protein